MSKQRDHDKELELLSEALRAISFTRDYVGEEMLPATKGWSWFDAGTAIVEYFDSIGYDGNGWVADFNNRVNLSKSDEVRKVFKPGDWVVGTDKYEGCSEVFEGSAGDYQPFDFLNDFDPNHYRIATDGEKAAAIEYITKPEEDYEEK